MKSFSLRIDKRFFEENGLNENSYPQNIIIEIINIGLLIKKSFNNFQRYNMKNNIVS